MICARPIIFSDGAIIIFIRAGIIFTRAIMFSGGAIMIIDGAIMICGRPIIIFTGAKMIINVSIIFSGRPKMIFARAIMFFAGTEIIFIAIKRAVCRYRAVCRNCLVFLNLKQNKCRRTMIMLYKHDVFLFQFIINNGAAIKNYGKKNLLCGECERFVKRN